MDSYAKGQRGEKLAVDFLRGLGYTIEVCNFQIRGGEIDIIAMDRNILVFVEVKWRAQGRLADGLESVGKAKAKRLFLAAERYLVRRGWMGECRFDVIAISGMNPPDILHIQQAFDASFFS